MKDSAPKGNLAKELELHPQDDLRLDEYEHRFGENKEIICQTDTPERGTEKIVVGLGGVVPLWAAGTVLHWRFNERSMARFRDPENAKNYFRRLLSDAQRMWGWVPVRFQESSQLVDFEYGLTRGDDCSNGGCVLASAFFPAATNQDLLIYPVLFNNSYDYQVNVMAHEIGHIFGLRHFFANISETWEESEIFGEHNPFSIMNYGNKSVLTDADRGDLYRLYEAAWSGRLSHVGKLKIALIRARSLAGRMLETA